MKRRVRAQVKSPSRQNALVKGVRVVETIEDLASVEKLLEERWVVEDERAWPIFEDPLDELRYHRRRSCALVHFTSAFCLLRSETKRLQKAGIRLQDAFERLQDELRNAVGDAAYWREFSRIRDEQMSNHTSWNESRAALSSVNRIQVDETEDTDDGQSIFKAFSSPGVSNHWDTTNDPLLSTRHICEFSEASNASLDEQAVPTVPEATPGNLLGLIGVDATEELRNSTGSASLVPAPVRSSVSPKAMTPKNQEWDLRPVLCKSNETMCKAYHPKAVADLVSFWDHRTNSMGTLGPIGGTTPTCCSSRLRSSSAGPALCVASVEL